MGCTCHLVAQRLYLLYVISNFSFAMWYIMLEHRTDHIVCSGCVDGFYCICILFTASCIDDRQKRLICLVGLATLGEAPLLYPHLLLMSGHTGGKHLWAVSTSPLDRHACIIWTEMATLGEALVLYPQFLLRSDHSAILLLIIVTRITTLVIVSPVRRLVFHWPAM